MSDLDLLRPPRFAGGTGYLFASRNRRTASRLHLSGALLGCAIGLTGLPEPAAAQSCTPVLALENAQLSGMRPPTLQRRWTATVTADIAQCATRSGRFQLAVTRIKENAPDLPLRETFDWSAPSIEIGIELWADEALIDARIEDVEVCPCASGRTKSQN